MKIIILLITISLFTTQYCVAQSSKSSDNRSNLQFGLKAGINSSNVYDAQGDQFVANSKIGFAAGAFACIPFGSLLGFQPEILFSQKGFKSTGNLLGSSYDLTRTTSYIDIPLLFAVKPTTFLTILAGPQYSYLLKQRDEFTSTLNSSAQEQEFANDNIRKNILSFIGGVELNSNQFVLSLRAAWDLQNNNGDGTSTTPRYKNVWYQATFGIKI